MYSGDPHSVSAIPVGCMYLAKPKSAILSSASALALVNNRFWGLRSLCMRFCARMARRPDAICFMKCRATSSVTRPCFLINSDTSPPAQYSRTRKIFFSSLMMSWSLMMLPWRERWRTWISDSRDSRSLRLSLSSRISFTATRWPVSACRARQTTAKEPRPICLSTRQCPIWRTSVEGVDVAGAGPTAGSPGADGGGSTSMGAPLPPFKRGSTTRISRENCYADSTCDATAVTTDRRARRPGD
mmetsp:Transcript_5985/g.26811  ORF Transcript_5985/g.26811 Transcript_5985/m.26811 type:complete len:243 (+) Transcript_5985:566-1294(+)